jgi:hypothetical protein
MLSKPWMAGLRTRRIELVDEPDRQNWASGLPWPCSKIYL